MEYKKILLIVNPKAGITAYKYNIFDIIEEFCKKECITTTLTTLKAGDAIEFTQKHAADHDMVVCCGGDGTLNETVTALLRSKINIPIGYIPTGSTNDMAKTLDIPKKPKKSAEFIMEGTPLLHDIGRFGEDKYFCYTASFGAFTKVSYATPRKLKNIFGHFAYILGGIANAFEELTPHYCKVEADGKIYEGNFLLGGLFNSKSVGGIVKLNKCDVKLDDGLFELILVRAPKNPDELNKILKNLNKQRLGDDNFIIQRVKSATFTFKEPTSFTLDGECGGEVMSVTAENLPGAISIFKGKSDDTDK